MPNLWAEAQLSSPGSVRRPWRRSCLVASHAPRVATTSTGPASPRRPHAPRATASLIPRDGAILKRPGRASCTCSPQGQVAHARPGGQLPRDGGPHVGPVEAPARRRGRLIHTCVNFARVRAGGFEATGHNNTGAAVRARRTRSGSCASGSGRSRRSRASP